MQTILKRSPLPLVLMLLGGLTCAVPAEAGSRHHHYKLIDLGTLGGPGAATQDSLQFLTNRGVVVGWADTPTPEPNYPQSCFFLFCFDPFIYHAFRWTDGTLTDLGALPGVNSSAAFWIADNGLTAGFSENDLLDPLLNVREIRAVLWENNQLTDLGTLDGGYESAAFAVNTRGQVTGFSLNLVPDEFSGFGTQERVFLWDKEKGIRDLGTLGTGTDAGLLGFMGDIEINELGQVVACSYTNTTINPAIGTPTLDPFLWDEKNGMTDLGTLGGTLGCAVNLNNRGQVVGYSEVAGDTSFRPFIWTKPGPMRDLGTFGGNFGIAISINESGEAVGIATDQNDDCFFAALWRDGAVLNLGTLVSLPQSNAQWINSKEQIVGFSALCDFNFSSPSAFLWENGGPMVDLNTLVPPNSKLHLSHALHNNDRGEIAGDGTLPNGNSHNFLLIPCDDAHPNVEGCDYSLVEVNSVAASHVPGVAAPQKQLTPTEISRIRNLLINRHRGFMPRTR